VGRGLGSAGGGAGDRAEIGDEGAEEDPAPEAVGAVVAAAVGVRHVANPVSGGPPLTAQLRAQPRWFRRAYRWRAGIEGRIGVLKSCFGFSRCRDHGETGFARWVIFGALVANLRTIARATATVA